MKSLHHTKEHQSTNPPNTLYKTDRNPPITNHKPWLFEPVEVNFCFLRGLLESAEPFRFLIGVTEKLKVQRRFWHHKSHVIQNSRKANIFASHNKLLCKSTGTWPYMTWLNIYDATIKTVKNIIFVSPLILSSSMHQWFISTESAC